MLLILVTITTLLATIPTSSAWWYAMHHYHGHILNELNPNNVLYVRCSCSDDPGGNNYINVRSEYEWDFKPHLFRSTLWHCYLAPDYHRHAYFVAYIDATEARFIDEHHNFYWVAKEHGVYRRDPSTHDDHLNYYWEDN
ncbi:hypothetical protein LINPERPRIM_LOCUS10269 [Linum perenne]